MTGNGKKDTSMLTSLGLEPIVFVIGLLTVLFIFLTIRRNKPCPSIRIVDGDSVNLDGLKCRLYGIDAPELSSRDGERAKIVLSTLVHTAQNSKKGLRYQVKGRCRYGRPLIVLYNGRKDLNGEMVSMGFARAYGRYSKAYVLRQLVAIVMRRGLWSNGYFWHPERTRHS